MNTLALLAIERIVIPAVLEYLEKKNTDQSVAAYNDMVQKDPKEQLESLVRNPVLNRSAIDAVVGLFEKIFGGGE